MDARPYLLPVPPFLLSETEGNLPVHSSFFN